MVFLLVGLIGCQIIPPSPQPQVVATFLTAELVGTLTKGEGCIRVNTVNESFGVVFPPDASITELENSLTIVTGLATNTPREINIPFGERVRLSGGEVESLPSSLAETVSDSCEAPYWVLGETISRVP
jgi:hypothetical protein